MVRTTTIGQQFLKRDNRSFGTKATQYVIAKFISAVLASCLVPYKQRCAGWAFFQYVVSPVSKNKERILENVTMLFPNWTRCARKVGCRCAKQHRAHTDRVVFSDGFLKVIDNCPLTGMDIRRLNRVHMVSL